MPRETLLLSGGSAKAIKALSDIPGLLTKDATAAFGKGPDGLSAAFKSSVWAYRAATIRAFMLARIPLKLYTANPDPETPDEEVKDHPLMGNKALGSGATRRLMITELALTIWGRAYLVPKPGPLGASLELQWLNPKVMVPKLNPERTQLVGYEYRANRQQPKFYKPEELVAISYFDPDNDFGGLAPMEVALAAAGADRNTMQFVEAFFRNSARPDGLLTSDQASLNDDEVKRVLTWWQRLFRGVTNQFKTGIAWGGLKWQAIQPAPKDLAMTALREEVRRDICVALGIPPALLVTDQKYSNYEQARKSAYHETVIPEADFIADELNAQLVERLFPGEDLYLAFDYDAIDALQEDATAKFERAAKALQSGAKIDDVLEMMGFDAIEEPDRVGEDGATADGDRKLGQRRYIPSSLQELAPKQPVPEALQPGAVTPGTPEGVKPGEEDKGEADEAQPGQPETGVSAGAPAAQGGAQAGPGGAAPTPSAKVTQILAEWRRDALAALGAGFNPAAAFPAEAKSLPGALFATLYADLSTAKSGKDVRDVFERNWPRPAGPVDPQLERILDRLDKVAESIVRGGGE